MNDGHPKMQNEKRHSLKKESHSMNRFNNSEYERWSEGVATTQSPETLGGIDGFLGTTKHPQVRSQDIPVTLIETGENGEGMGHEHGVETE